MRLFPTTFVFCLILSVFGLSAQDLDEEYAKEFTWGINKNTNSGVIGGLVFKVGRYHKENVYSTYGLEMVNVRHPNELKRPAPSSGTLYIWGKENYLYSIRLQYGRETIRYKKAPQQGVQISTIFSGGPTLGIVSPYYLLYEGSYQKYEDIKDKISINSVQGAGKLFQGLPESKLVPGLNAKAGVLFEFGTFRDNVAGLELGLSAELFPKQIIIIPAQKNRALFTALYANMVWGNRH